MLPTIELIKCLRNPDHGTATKRRLPPEELESEGADVFEINCPHCGRYEYQEFRVTE